MWQTHTGSVHISLVRSAIDSRAKCVFSFFLVRFYPFSSYLLYKIQQENNFPSFFFESFVSSLCNIACIVSALLFSVLFASYSIPSTFLFWFVNFSFHFSRCFFFFLQFCCLSLYTIVFLKIFLTFLFTLLAHLGNSFDNLFVHLRHSYTICFS